MRGELARVPELSAQLAYVIMYQIKNSGASISRSLELELL
jgi:hypothetical protein